MQYTNSIYKQIDALLSNPSVLKVMLDTINAKYNNTDWKLFTDVLPEQRTRKWNEILDTTDISVMATVMQEDAIVPVRAMGGFEAYAGSIPAFGHGFTFSADDQQHIYEMGMTEDAAMQHLISKFSGRADSIIQGIHSRINFWVYQALGQGKMMVDKDTNPDGIAFTYNYKVPTEQLQCALGSAATARWTNTTDSTTADPIADIRRWCQMFEDNIGVTDIMMLMTKATFRLFLQHPTVISQIKNMTNLVSAAGLVSLKDADLWKLVRDAFGLPPVMIVDTKSTVEKDGEASTIDSPFGDNIVSIVPRTKLFDLYHCPSTFADMTSNDIVVSTTENGLIYTLKEYAQNGRVSKFSFQTVAAPVLRDPKKIIIADVSKNSKDGVLA